MARYVRDVRAVPLWLLREYLMELGGQGDGEDLVGDARRVGGADGQDDVLLVQRLEVLIVAVKKQKGVDEQRQVVDQRVQGLAARAVRYHEEHKLGVYRKAKLGNVFKWKLTELGYSSAFVERATKEIVTRLAAK